MDVLTPNEIQELKILNDIRALLISMNVFKLQHNVLASDDLYPNKDVQRSGDTSARTNESAQFVRSKATRTRSMYHKATTTVPLNRRKSASRKTSERDSSSTSHSPSASSNSNSGKKTSAASKTDQRPTTDVRRHESMRVIPSSSPSPGREYEDPGHHRTSGTGGISISLEACSNKLTPNRYLTVDQQLYVNTQQNHREHRRNSDFSGSPATNEGQTCWSSKSVELMNFYEKPPNNESQGLPRKREDSLTANSLAGSLQESRDSGFLSESNHHIDNRAANKPSTISKTLCTSSHSTSDHQLRLITRRESCSTNTSCSTTREQLTNNYRYRKDVVTPHEDHLSFYPSYKAQRVTKLGSSIEALSNPAEGMLCSSSNTPQTVEQLPPSHQVAHSNVEDLLDGRSLFSCSSTSPLYFSKLKNSNLKRISRLRRS